MNATLTLDKAGRVLIPGEVRRRLNLLPGARLNLELLAERIEITVASDADAALGTAPSRRRVLPASGRPFDATAATRTEREAQARRRSRR
jgi:AbrB family looped-hinge helix DNA binding protein